MQSRSTLVRLLMLACLFFACRQALAEDADWTLFKQRFVRPDGRVVDDGREAISHSEGQGVAMFLAVRYDDVSTLKKVWQWTRQNLQVRGDDLLAWRWSPKDGVTDPNNATDGDLFVAWALVRAYRKWGDEAELAGARQIAQAVRSRLLRNTARGPVLLPGAVGFDKDDGIVVNLSYWIFPALAALAEADPAPQWAELAQTGVRLLQESHFGRWGLPGDWVRLGDKLALAAGFPPRFGYDAVRIPLYLLWSGQGDETLLQPYRAFWRYFEGARFLPAWTNLSDDSVDSYDTSPGIRAIAQLALVGVESARLPALDERQDYYSSALLLLAKTLSWERRGP